MWSQYKIEETIEEYAPTLIKQLGLRDWHIDFYVIDSRDKSIQKELKEDGIPYKETKAACMFFDTKVAEVYIYSNSCLHKTDCIRSIYHELVHIVLSQLHIPTSKESYKAEEQIVRAFEKVYWKNLPKL